MDLLTVKSREKNAVICVFKLSGAAWEGGEEEEGFQCCLKYIFIL